MAGSEILTIGSVSKHRGEYNKDTVYYLNNQVTMYGCVFQALSNNFSNMPPLTVASDKSISLANTNLWKCIIDNVALYNATLSTNNIDSRVATIEGNIDTIKSTAQTAQNTAQSAYTIANTAMSTANSTKQKTDNLEQRVDDNQSRIQNNTNAIDALQKGASPLNVVCSTKAIEFTPDDDGHMEISVPVIIYDNGTAITDKATVTATIYTPVQTGLITTWDGTAAKATAYVPGKHELEIRATYQGKIASEKFEFYLTLPTTVTTYSDSGEEVQLDSVESSELPIKVSVIKTGENASELLFNIPTYLNAEKVTCNGIDVPVTEEPEPMENYTTLCTEEEVVSGTYDFIIQ